MKTKFALFLSTAGLLHAGSPDLEISINPKPEPWIKPLIDIRARYEFGNVSPLDDSNSLSIREHLGFKTMKWKGVSLLVEGEFTQVAGADSNAGAGPEAYPYNPKNTAIADPRNAELNQLFGR